MLYKIVLNENKKEFELKPDSWPPADIYSHMIYLLPFDTGTTCPQIAIWVESYTGSTVTICTGSTVTIYSYILNTSGASYQWFINDNPVPGGKESKLVYSPENKDQVYCKLTGDTCGEATSNVIEITVVQKRVPTVEVQWINYSRPEDSQYICSGDTVMFKVTGITYGGTYPYPTFQWYTDRPGSWYAIPGQNREVMSYKPISGETICVYMESNEWCINPTGATDCVKMDVNPKFTVSADIIPTGTTCSGTSVTYMVTRITNGGTTPTFQWYVNSTLKVGETYSAYTYTPNNGDLITCRVTSSLKCVYGPATPTHTAIVSNLVPVSITIESTPASAGGVVQVYTGYTIVFYVKNSTECPDQHDNTYQWYLNDSEVGTDDRTYPLSSPIDGDEVYCEITADCACRTGNPAKSNEITVDIVTDPKYSWIKEDTNIICTGTSVCFSAYTYNFDPSPTPTYQWKVKGNNVGTNNYTYCSNTLADGDIVSCVVTQNGNYPSINPVTMIVNSYVNTTVDITIYPPGLYYCEGSMLEFAVSGYTPSTLSNPSFQWQKYIGTWINVGSNLPYILIDTMNDKDKMRVIMTPTESCTYPSTSNEIQVNMLGEPSVSVVASSSCYDLNVPVTFTATPTNGGSSPTYNWYVSPNMTPETEHSNVFTYTFTTMGDRIIICEMIASTICIILPNVVPQTAFYALYIEECGCSCYSGFVPTIDGTMCYKTETGTTLGTQIIQTAVLKKHEGYSEAGTIFFEPGYNTSGTTSENYTILNSGIWTSSGDILLGPMNRCGLWATDYWSDQTIHFSYCFTLTEGKTYYVGIGCDNYATIKMDGNLIVQQNQPALTEQFGYDTSVTFKYWFVYPIQLTAGFHVIEILGHNIDFIAGIGAEIYDATLQEMINATNLTTFYNDHVIFSTIDEIGESIQIVSGGLNCANGWTLVLCDGDDPYCLKTTYIPCGSTPP